MLMMLPFEAPTIFEGIHKSYFRMPRVVKDQRSKFENDDLFRQLSHESAVKYTGFKDRPLEERQMKFFENCHQLPVGHTEVSIVQSGNQFTLVFDPTLNPAYNNQGCDFNKELGKVHIKSGFILNGVCVVWRGWIDTQRLEGFGCLEFDEFSAYHEESMLKQQIDKQQCNMSANSQSQAPGRLNHLSLGPPLGQASANSMAGPPPPPPPVGLSPACLGPHGIGPAGAAGIMQPPPVSLADSTHYGHAAIAAAAAAAFHQALSAGAHPATSQALHQIGASPSKLAAAVAASNGQPPPGSMLPSLGSQALAAPPPYSNGAGQIIPATSVAQTTTQQRTSPTHNLLNGSNQNGNNNSRSPELRENNHQLNTIRRQATKRAHEEQTSIDDVDVVSDISAHDLDFPPRRIFKSEPLTTAHHHRANRRVV